MYRSGIYSLFHSIPTGCATSTRSKIEKGHATMQFKQISLSLVTILSLYIFVYNSSGQIQAKNIFDKVSQSESILCNINQPPYNAIPDGKTNNTNAIQKAINECGTEPGAKSIIFVPGPGSYLTGALQLRSRTEIRIHPSATILGVNILSQYPFLEPLPSYCLQRGGLYAPLFGGDGLESVEITGGGTIDGNFFTGQGPRLVQFRRSINIVISNVTLTNSGFWTIHLYNCIP